MDREDQYKDYVQLRQEQDFLPLPFHKWLAMVEREEADRAQEG
jgi:hypothetical protein